MEFNVEKVTNEIIEFIRDYYKKHHLRGAVIGISGGKDSAVVAGLFSKALGSENVLGMWLPCNSNEKDKKDALEIANHFGFKLLEYDLTNHYNNYVKNVYEALYLKENKKMKDVYKITEEDLIDSCINIKPRMRIQTLYFFAALFSKLKKGVCIVPGTSNKSELYVGYFTKGGDNVSDIQVLADLSVDEVKKVGDYIGVPYHICHKTPDDGLSGKSDEEKLGVKYSDIDIVMKEEETGMQSFLISNEVREKVLKLHRNNLHKFNIPTYRKK